MSTIAITICAGATTKRTIRASVPRLRHASLSDTSRVSPMPSGRRTGAAKARQPYKPAPRAPDGLLPGSSATEGCPLDGAAREAVIGPAAATARRSSPSRRGTDGSDRLRSAVVPRYRLIDEDGKDLGRLHAVTRSWSPGD